MAEEEIPSSLADEVPLEHTADPMAVIPPEVLAEAEPQGQSISSMVDQEHLAILLSMGFSQAVCEKALFLTQGAGVEAAMGWIEENQNEPDFEEALMIVGQSDDPSKPKLSKEEAAKKALELQAELKAKRLEQEKQDAILAEKERVKMTKGLQKANEEQEEFKRKQAIRNQMEERKKDQEDLKAAKEQLRREHAARFGKEYVPGEDPTTPADTRTPVEKVVHSIKTIRECYPTFRSPGVAQTAIQTLRTLTNNVVAHPEEEKYRTIKTSNKALQERIVKVTGALMFLKAVGFAPAGEEYTIQNPDMAILQMGLGKLDEELARLQT